MWACTILIPFNPYRMNRQSKFDELMVRDYKARTDVKDYLNQKQQILDKYQKMKRPNKRLQKTANHANVRSDLEAQRLNLLAQGGDSEELKNEIAELKRKYRNYTSLYDAKKIPLLSK